MSDSTATPAPQRGVPVELDKTRRLRYSFATRRKLIEDLGGEEALMKGLVGEQICKVVWYGLVWEDPNLTIADVEEMVDFENLMDVVSAMSKALGYKTKPLVLGEDGRVVGPQSAAAENASQ